MYCMLGKNIQTGSISSSGCPITSHPSQTQPTNAVICVATLLLNKTLQKAQPIQRLCAFTKIAVIKSCHNLVKFQLDQPKKAWIDLKFCVSCQPVLQISKENKTDL